MNFINSASSTNTYINYTFESEVTGIEHFIDEYHANYEYSTSRYVDIDQLIEARFTAPPYVHFTCITIIILFALFGNIFVINSFLRKGSKKHNSDIYMLYLSMLDICACCMLVNFPMLPFYFKKGSQGEPLMLSLFFILMASLLFTYFGILVCIGLDGGFAVFRPYSYTYSRNKTVLIICIISLVCSVVGASTTVSIQIDSFNGKYMRLFSVIYMSSASIVIITSYIAISFKLKRQRTIINTQRTDWRARTGVSRTINIK